MYKAVVLGNYITEQMLNYIQVDSKRSIQYGVATPHFDK